MGQSAKKNKGEMIQIAESKKAKDVIEEIYYKKIQTHLQIVLKA